MSVTINSNPSPITDLIVGASVQLDSTVIGSVYVWEMLTKPLGSAAVFSSATIKNPTITPDLSGTYIVRLTVDGVQSLALFEAPLPRTGLHSPAHQEGSSSLGGNLRGSRGWTGIHEDLLTRMERQLSNAETVLCKSSFAGTIAVGNVCHLVSVSILAPGAAQSIRVPTVTKSSAITYSHLAENLIFIGGMKGESTLNQEEIGIFLRDGLVFGVDTTAFSAVGDPVYVSDSEGEYAATKGTHEKQIGVVYGSPNAAGAILFSQWVKGVGVSWLDAPSTTPALTDLFLSGGERIRAIIFDSTEDVVAASLPAATGQYNGRIVILINVGANGTTISPSGDDDILPGSSLALSTDGATAIVALDYSTPETPFWRVISAS